MRKLLISRQRALACFGTAYHCILGQSIEDHERWASEQNRNELMTGHDRNSIRNGETIVLEIPEEATTMFVIAYLEQRNLISQLLDIPAGHDDLHYAVITNFDGNRRLSLELREA